MGLPLWSLKWQGVRLILWRLDPLASTTISSTPCWFHGRQRSSQHALTTSRISIILDNNFWTALNPLIGIWLKIYTSTVTVALLSAVKRAMFLPGALLSSLLLRIRTMARATVYSDSLGDQFALTRTLCTGGELKTHNPWKLNVLYFWVCYGFCNPLLLLDIAVRSGLIARRQVMEHRVPGTTPKNLFLRNWSEE